MGFLYGMKKTYAADLHTLNTHIYLAILNERSSLLIQNGRKNPDNCVVSDGILSNCFFQGQLFAHIKLTEAENHLQEYSWRSMFCIQKEKGLVV